MKIFIEGRRNGYAPEQCGKTMTVGEMIDWLSQFDEEAKVYLRNDGGYTYGSITSHSFDEDWEEDGEEAEEE